MTPYRPDKFTDTFTHLDGAPVWEWLHISDIRIRLETASTLRRPAVEAISPLLKQHYPDHINHLKFRQMVGHMVRQVMEEQGYGLQRSNVKTRQVGCVYGYGNVYTKAWKWRLRAFRF